MFIENGQGIEEIRSRITLAHPEFSRKRSCFWLRCEISLRTKPTVFNNKSIHRIPHVRHRNAYQRQDCGTASASLAFEGSSSKEGFVGLVMVRDFLRVERSGASSCPHRLARGENELQANWSRGPWHSRKTWNPKLDSESSATHDCGMTGWKSLWTHTGPSSLGHLRP